MKRVLPNNKQAIVTLTRGYPVREWDKYNDLIQRNIAIKESCKLDQIRKQDYLIFHEGNITLDQQYDIAGCTPFLPLRFVDVSKSKKAFRKDKQQIAFDPKTARFPLGYRHMCSFWFTDFWHFVKQYDYILRIDEDCSIRFDPDIVFSELRDSLAVYGQWSNDREFVTKGLNEFTLDFFRQDIGEEKSPRPASGPYTNVFGLNIRKLLANRRLSAFIRSVDQSDNIYRLRWGDLPLWGEVLHYFFQPQEHRLVKQIKYFHGSHGRDVN